MTSLSTRLQNVAGGLEVQLGNLWRVSPRGCHHRALWPHPAAVLGLPVKCISHKAPWWHGFHGAWHCLSRRGDHATPWEMWASQECQLTGNNRDTKHTSYNSHGGAFLNWNGGLLAKDFHCLVKSQYFPWEKKTKKHNTINNNFLKRMTFSPDLSNQGLRNPKDWVSINRILSGTLKN